MEQYEKLILEITALAMKANRVTGNHFFVNFSGHVNCFDVDYIENGYIDKSLRKNKKQRRVAVVNLYFDATPEDQILIELNKGKIMITNLIEGNKKEPQEKVQ